MNGKPTLLISSKLQQQIDFLHQQVGDKEWCGPLIYEIVSGNISSPDHLVIRGLGLFPMDIGTKGGTDFEMDGESAVQMFSEYPDLENGKARTGFVHSHNSMRVYFSGTDDEELEDNIDDHNAYVSLIVGFNMQHVARVVFKMEVENKYTFKDMDESLVEHTPNDKTEKVCYFDCDVINEFDISSSFVNKYNTIVENKRRKKKEEEEKKKQNSKKNKESNHGGHTSNQTFHISDSEIEQFVCKLLLGNPSSKANSTWMVLHNTGNHLYINEDDVFEIIHECACRVFERSIDDLSMVETGQLIENTIYYLKEDTMGGKSLSQSFSVVKDLVAILEDIIELILQTMEKEQENEQIAQF